MINSIILAAVVPFMTQHRNMVPSVEVSTNFFGSVTGIVTAPYVNGLESDPSIALTNGTIYIHGTTIKPLTSYSETDPIWTSNSNSFETAIHTWVEGKEYVTKSVTNVLSGRVDTLYTDKADRATTLLGYGISDAKIENGVITLGENTITPLTSQTKANWTETDTTSAAYIQNKPLVVTYDNVAPDAHKTAAGILTAAENTAGTISTNVFDIAFSENADYALTNLTAGALSLRSGEIGNYTTAGAAFTLALDFSAAAGRSGDCLLYVANTGAADATITLTPNTYTYVATDIAKARTLTAATTNIVSFTRVKADTILVSKIEVK